MMSKQKAAQPDAPRTQACFVEKEYMSSSKVQVCFYPKSPPQRG